MRGLFAVLTGDLVKSSPLSADRMAVVRKAVDGAAKALRGSEWGKARFVRGEPEFFRGDAWQMLLTKPHWALRAAVFVRTSLLVHGVDTRVSIGIGTVERVSRTRVSLSRGKAFTLSGHGLDKIGSRFRMALAIQRDLELPTEWLTAVVRLCDSVIVQWESRQTEAARLLTLHKNASHADIGKKLTPSVTQQSVTKSLRSAGWYGLEHALEQFERIVWKQP